MGVNEFKYEFYLNVDLNVIFNIAKSWLHTNGFKIKEESNEQNRIFINSYTGKALPNIEQEAKRWLEIRASNLPTGNYFVLYEKLSAWTAGALKSDLIKEEVLALAAFLQSGHTLSQPQSQQQQQQIVVNVVPQPPPVVMPAAVNPVCPRCQTPIRVASAIFCERCGQRLAPVQSAPQQPPVSPPANEAVLFCSACGTHLHAGAAFCKRCGAAVERIAPETPKMKIEQSVDDSLEPQPPRHCSNCGKVTEGADVLFCKYCGNNLEDS